MAAVMSEDLVSIVLPTYNRRSWLPETLKPLLEDPATGEIIVVVDGCADGSLEYLKEVSTSDPRIRPIFQENAGPNAARQRGLETARFPVVLFVDDDVVASPGLVSGHGRHHQEGSHQIVVGYMPVAVPEKRRPGQAATLLYASDYEALCREYEAAPESILRRLWSGNMSGRRADMLRVGLLASPDLRYHEDMHFGFRAEESGLGAMFDRTLLARHSHQRKLRQFAADCRRSGDARAQLCAQYPEREGSISPLAMLLPWHSLVISVVSWGAIRRVSSPFTIFVTVVAGHLRLWGAENIGARLLGQIETVHSFRRRRGTQLPSTSVSRGGASS
jgi:GT2 family glycosyltransferase